MPSNKTNFVKPMQKLAVAHYFLFQDFLFFFHVWNVFRYVFEALKETRKQLNGRVPLIGFTGKDPIGCIAMLYDVDLFFGHFEILRLF